MRIRPQNRQGLFPISLGVISSKIFYCDLPRNTYEYLYDNDYSFYDHMLVKWETKEDKLIISHFDER